MKPKADGTRFDLRLVYDSTAGGNDRLSQVLQSFWQKIGVRTVFQGSTRSTELKQVFTDWDFDATLQAYSTAGDPALGVERLYITSAIRKAPFVNASGYSNPAIDKLFAEGADATATADRARAYRAAAGDFGGGLAGAADLADRADQCREPPGEGEMVLEHRLRLLGRGVGGRAEGGAARQASLTDNWPGVLSKVRFEDLPEPVVAATKRVPPLRERPGDVAALADYFARRYAEVNGLAYRKLSRAALARLAAHGWRGNVRELENTIHRAVLLAAGEEIDEAAIELGPQSTLTGSTLTVSTGPAAHPDGHLGGIASLVGRRMDDVERDLIIETLSHTLGNRTHAATILGISSVGAAQQAARLRRAGRRRAAAGGGRRGVRRRPTMNELTVRFRRLVRPPSGVAHPVRIAAQRRSGPAIKQAIKQDSKQESHRTQSSHRDSTEFHREQARTAGKWRCAQDASTGVLRPDKSHPAADRAVQRSSLTLHMDGASGPATRARKSSASFGACRSPAHLRFLRSFAVESLP